MNAKKLFVAFLFGLGLTVACLWFLGIGPLPVARAATYQVTKTDASGTGSLRWAIDAANGTGVHDTITFAPSVSGTIELTGTLPQIVNDLTITGPGATTLAISGDDTYRVLDIASNAAVTISGVTIRDGYHASLGGGIYSQGTLLLIDTDIVSNTSDHSGGGVCVHSGKATLTGGQIISNAAAINGGGIWSQGTLLLIATDVVSNTAGWGGGVYVYESGGAFIQTGDSTVGYNTANYGGGVYVDEGSATLSGGQIVSNTANVEGGGVYVKSGGAFTQTGASTITLNHAKNRGGGMYVNQGDVKVEGGSIISNSAGDNGGGVYVDRGDVTLGGGQIAHNTADDHGGGVYVDETDAVFTQTEGTAIAYNQAQTGGGVRVDFGTVILGGQILGNTAESGTTGGGGLFNGNGSATLSGAQVVSNTAQERGGGIYSYSALTLTNTTVSHNRATNREGGGIFVNGGSASLSGGEIISNSTGDDGGGVYIVVGSVTLNGTHVLSNTAKGLGGGVRNRGVLNVTDSVFRGNSTDANTSWGGGIYNSGVVTVSGSAFSGNSATGGFSGYGGGTCNAGTGTMTIVNCTFSGNDAVGGTEGKGGGIYNQGGTTVMTYTTVVSNTASDTGGGIHVTSGAVFVKNTLVAYNDSTGTTDDNCGGSALTSTGHNLDSDDTCGLTATTDITPTDPLLGPLTYDMGTWAHPLLEGSRGIDEGVCVAGITTDQRGVTRIDPCDIGAYEYEWVWQKVFLPLVLKD
jgi:hypothetical protein